jgi:hypothetical protein
LEGRGSFIHGFSFYTLERKYFQNTLGYGIVRIEGIMDAELVGRIRAEFGLCGSYVLTAKSLDVPYSRVWSCINKETPVVERKPREKKARDEEKAMTAVRLRGNGMTFKDISTTMGISIGSTYRLCSDVGFEFGMENRKRNSIESANLGRLIAAIPGGKVGVSIDVGVVDYLAENVIYEVKGLLNRTNMYTAIGQVLLYRDATGLDVCIVGTETKYMKVFDRVLKSYGIRVMFV